MKKKSFTLIEIVISLVVFSIIFGVLFSIFLRIIRTKTDIEARQTLVKSTYDLVEQLNTKLQNYTIDYEEYFNRTEVGCNIAQDGFGTRIQ
jgi:type II secretory pathway pseudopilin PulG